MPFVNRFDFLGILLSFGIIFFWQFGNLVAAWYIFSRSGIFYREKIWQPCQMSHSRRVDHVEEGGFLLDKFLKAAFNFFSNIFSRKDQDMYICSGDFDFKNGAI